MLKNLLNKTVNGHTKSELRKHYAGKFIENPNTLPNFANVTLFQIGTEGWWEHGEICQDENGTKKINVYDGYYDFDEVEVYLDTRFKTTYA